MSDKGTYPVPTEDSGNESAEVIGHAMAAAPAPAPPASVPPRPAPPMPPAANRFEPAANGFAGNGAHPPTVGTPSTGGEPTTNEARPDTNEATESGPATSPTDTARLMTEILTELVPADQVRVDGNFFDDLGADSMVMARFCARARKEPGLPSVSMKDVYENPTIESLATALANRAPPQPPTVQQAVSTTVDVPVQASRRQYVLCGTLQFLFLSGFAFVATLIAVRGFFWISAGSGVVNIYLRTASLISAAFVVTSVLPILAKWLLIGRWKPQPIRIWSLRYFRFWVVKALIRSSPLVALNGRSVTSSSSPLFPFYLRMLGAKIGRGVTIMSRNVPVCTDLLTIGDNTIVRKDSFLNCYRASGGVIEPGSVTLGKHVFVGEATVLDINTTVGDGAQIGHASSLQSGQSVPADGRYQGAPAVPTDIDYRTGDTAGGRTRRRAIYGTFQLLNLLVLTGPVTITLVILLIDRIPALGAIVRPQTSGLTGTDLVRNAAVISGLLLVASIIIGLLVVGMVPRLLRRFVEPGTTYPIYGVRYFIHRVIAGLTNSQFFMLLFGDSSFIVHYLRWIGYDLDEVVQTGSNFGSVMKHESPFLVSVGSGTVVADGLSVINADFSSTSFRLEPVSIGANNFLGNNIAYSADGKTGDDCLLGTKVAVPVTGEVREGVGLLGSPSFEIPRTVERDRALEIAHNEELFRPLLLTAKNRHNIVTIGLFLFLRWLLSFGLLLLLSGVLYGYENLGAAAVAVAVVVTPVITIGYWAMVEKAVARLQALEPDGCSIYHRNFWRHERYWKLPAFRYRQAYDGTPFKTMIWRLIGVRMGAQVFDDGCFIVEKSLVTVGDNCTLNAGSILQCHSQEDGGFKSNRTSLGSGCTLGVGAFVHYGVTMADSSVLSADSFLMKGQETTPQTVWTGNPAQEVLR